MSLREVVERMRGHLVLVVGDAMSDRYVFGRVDRLSPEGPVPVFVPERDEWRPGGAANVARQLQALGCTVPLSFSEERCVKTRYFVGHQMMFRVDADVISQPKNQHIRYAHDLVTESLSAVVLSDYAKGWLTFEMCQGVIERAKTLGIPTVVDPKGGHWAKYDGASLICPNLKELTERIVGSQAAHPIREDMLVKRGAEGIEIVEPGKERVRVSATARHVFDVTGAGDTVVAVVAAALAAGASYHEAATIASIAAGYVVGEVGTTVCPLPKLLELVGDA